MLLKKDAFFLLFIIRQTFDFLESLKRKKNDFAGRIFYRKLEEVNL